MGYAGGLVVAAVIVAAGVLLAWSDYRENRR